MYENDLQQSPKKKAEKKMFYNVKIYISTQSLFYIIIIIIIIIIICIGIYHLSWFELNSSFSSSCLYVSYRYIFKKMFVCYIIAIERESTETECYWGNSLGFVNAFLISLPCFFDSYTYLL